MFDSGYNYYDGLLYFSGADTEILLSGFQWHLWELLNLNNDLYIYISLDRVLFYF